jgi:ADP-heptose:LPS heptosyltransferase
VRVRQKQLIDRYFGYFLIAVLLPLTRSLGILLSRDHSGRKPPRRLLFIKLMGLGSLIVASDAIAAMRRCYPDARFVLLADPNIAAAVGPFGIFDEIHVVKTDHVPSTLLMMMRFFARTWTWRRLWVIDLEVYSKLTTVVALLTLAINRFGFYLPPVPFRKYLNTHNVPFDQGAYLGGNYLTMARMVTGEASLAPAAPFVRSDDTDKPFIALNNTCSGLADVRRLPDTVFAELCQWLLEHTPYRLVLLGSPEERPSIDRFIDGPALRQQKHRILNFAGAPGGFEAYYALLRGACAFLVSIDSGPLHIARKLGLPTISIWGPTDPANYLPLSLAEKDRHRYLYSGVSCSPCIHRHSRLPCGGDNICMKTISSAAIVGKIIEMMDDLSPSGRCELSQRVESGPPVLI